jgi:predicted nucleic acid-binding protein
MIVVADTSPINYLVLIRHAEILQPLYRKVILPSTVAKELTSAGTPEAVIRWMTNAPQWLEVQTDPPWDATLDFLDAGEAAAINLAQILRAETLLIDDGRGRREAKRRQIAATGTMGVLVDAHLAGLLEFDEAVQLLRSTNFRLSPQIEWLARRRISGER